MDLRPTIVCAWCRKIIHHGTPLVSHGICSRCATQFRRRNASSSRLREAQERYRLRQRPGSQ